MGIYQQLNNERQQLLLLRNIWTVNMVTESPCTLQKRQKGKKKHRIENIQATPPAQLQKNK